MNNVKKVKNTNRIVLLGAALLMATSAIGPGFLTQTTVFTETILASFGFDIFIVIPMSWLDGYMLLNGILNKE
ncbi:hypothetical protein KQ939_11595 [Planococcus sp. CP5-4]|uniref:hypothetical protein n=1 Tax=unclassified Planococcus (in: firmicutes) TaxID=2662419 RepID=UPI001C23DAAB|nr:MULTISPECIES: hypothetical protein [unclassified Planococcus (in: firmicutes)]MBU9672575.1 hypothetical protein [Planococcus sp. CP5-4_YE]MBV0909625.1 hypothetical protein [Planococcus sp. CP5-4_UN]MBW6064355.1 hypothetical protein [Planococcus sp. CP5-4]